MSRSKQQNIYEPTIGGDRSEVDLLQKKINDGSLDPAPDEDLPSSQLAQEISALIRGNDGSQQISPVEAVRLISTANARLRMLGIKKPTDSAYGAMPDGEEIPF